MTTPVTIPDVLKNLVESVLNEAHTVLPGMITSIDYTEGLVSVKPLLKDKRSNSRILEYPEIGDVPLWVYCGNMGSARVTVPVMVGDIVAIHFCEREASTFILSDGKTVTEPIEYSPLGLYPLYATPSIHPIKVSRPIDPVNVIIENGETQVKISPEGEVTITGSTINLQGNTNITGNVTLNGDLTQVGNTNTVGTLTNNGVNVGSTHTHPITQEGVTDPPQ